MKVATICHSVEFITNTKQVFHMALAHELVEDAELQYFYSLASKKGHFIIIDNGAAEGQLMDSERLMQIVNYINPDEVVMPDALRDMHKTLLLLYSSEVLRHVPPRKRMMVPQGKGWADWLQCLEYMVGRWDFATIGIPKWIEDELPGGRLRALAAIEDAGFHRKYHVHLLGLAKLPQEEGSVLGTKYIRSLDTGLPIALAQIDKTIRAAERRRSYHYGTSFNHRTAHVNVIQLKEIIYAHQSKTPNQR